MLLAALLIPLALIGLRAAPVAAANTLVASTPADGGTISLSPTSVQLIFAEKIPATNTVQLACDGKAIPLSDPKVGEDQKSITVTLTGPQAFGSCRVVWVLTDPKADQTTGAISFKVQPSATTASTPPGGTQNAGSGAAAETTSAAPSDLRIPLSLARWVGYLGLAALFGALVLIVLAWQEGVEYILTVRFLRSAWIVALLGSLATVVVLSAAARGGGLTDGVSPMAWTDIGKVTGGWAALFRLLLVAATGWVVMRPERVTDPMTQNQALAIPGLAVATMAMTRGTTGGVIGIVAGIVHALSMAVWFGGLAILARVVLAGSGDEDLVHAVRGFRRISTPAILATCLSGLALLYQFDWGHLFDSNHGKILLLKTVGVAAMVFVGLAARDFIRERLSRIDTLSGPIAGRLRRAVSIEALAGLAVLGITAGLTSTLPPSIGAASVASPELGQPVAFVNSQQEVQATIRMTQRVGANAVLITITKPKSGLQNVQVRFNPPTDSPVNPIMLNVPLHGAGSAILPKSAGMMLNAAGTWMVLLYINGVLIDSHGVLVEAVPNA